MRNRAFAVALGAALMLAPTTRADVDSGPKAGEKVPALKAFGVVGSVEGKETNYAADREDAPTVYLFIQAEEGGIPVGGRPAARFMKVLDNQITKAADKAEIVAVWLGEKAVEKHKTYLPRFQMSLKLEHTALAAFDGERAGPTGWGINADAHVTAVIAYKGKVLKSFALTSVNETDVRPVLAELKKATGK